ncbi:MAG TPA: agmatine deiminase family protein, partial [Vicinamibacteria bacterium]|nr:agmatine deiminase family protein [Vicinamibacteria bacterium]
MALVSRRDLLALGSVCVFARRSSAFEEPKPADPIEVVRPEFRRTLESALITLPAGTMDYAAHDGLGRAALSRFLEAVFQDVLAAFPSYTKIHVATRVDRRDFGQRAVKLAGERATQLHVVTDPEVEIEVWAQDLGEPIFQDGQLRFVVGMRMDASMGPQSQMSIDRKRVAEIAFGRDAVMEAPFAFEGGNLAFDSRGERTRVFVGYNVVTRTIAAYAARNRNVTRKEVLADIARTFGDAEIVVIGDEKQSPLLQHIDQSFLLLDDQVVVATRLADESLPTEARQLRRHTDQLRELGYDVVFLDHESTDVEQGRFSINAVPYV